MPVKKRIAVAIALLILAMAVYGTLKLYAPFLVFYVVEQTLIQKAPPGTDPAHLHERLQLLLSSRPTPEARMEELFRISAYLEKIQVLTSEQLEFLLGTPPHKSYLRISPFISGHDPSGSGLVSGSQSFSEFEIAIFDCDCDPDTDPDPDVISEAVFCGHRRLDAAPAAPWMLGISRKPGSHRQFCNFFINNLELFQVSGCLITIERVSCKTTGKRSDATRGGSHVPRRSGAAQRG